MKPRVRLSSVWLATCPMLSPVTSAAQRLRPAMRDAIRCEMRRLADTYQQQSMIWVDELDPLLVITLFRQWVIDTCDAGSDAGEIHGFNMALNDWLEANPSIALASGTWPHHEDGDCAACAHTGVCHLYEGRYNDGA